MHLIELTGLPGSGKSSLLPFIKKHFKKKGLNIYDRKTLIFATSDTFAYKVFYHIYNFSPSIAQDLLTTFLYRKSTIKEETSF